MERETDAPLDFARSTESRPIDSGVREDHFTRRAIDGAPPWAGF